MTKKQEPSHVYRKDIEKMTFKSSFEEKKQIESELTQTDQVNMVNDTTNTILISIIVKINREIFSPLCNCW